MAGEEQTLASVPGQQEQVLTALMALRRGEVGPFQRLEDDLFLHPIGLGEAQDGLVRRWTSLLSQDVEGAPDQDLILRALQARWQRLRTIAPNQRYAFLDFPIQEAKAFRRQWIDQAFDRGDMAGFWALTRDDAAQDPRRTFAKDSLGLTGRLANFAGLSLTAETVPPAEPTPFRVDKGHLWCLDVTGTPLWRLPLASDVQVHLGLTHAAFRTSMRFCTVDVMGKIHDITMHDQVRVLGLSGQYLWLHLGSRAYRVDLESRKHLQINLPDEPLGPPLSVGQDAVWLLKKGLCQSSGPSVVQRIRTNLSFKVQQEWRRSVDGPWLQADGKWYRMRPSDGSLADLACTGHEREVVAAFGRLTAPTQTDREILRDAILAVGKASGLELSQVLTLAGVTDEDRLRLAMRYWLDGDSVAGLISAEVQRHPEVLLCVDPAADPRDPPESWRRTLSARSWFQVLTTVRTATQSLVRQDLVSGCFPWKEVPISGLKAKFLMSGSSPDLGWIASDHESRIRMKRENDLTVVENFSLSSTALCWRVSIETRALLPSRSIARSGQYLLLAEGQSRMQVIASLDGRLIATWFLPNGSADPGRSAVIDTRTLATARPNQSVLDLWSDLGRSQKSVPLPSPALWLVSPVEGVLLIGHEDGQVRLWPEGTPVPWPASRQEPVLCDRRYLWIGGKAFDLDH